MSLESERAHGVKRGCECKELMQSAALQFKPEDSSLNYAVSQVSAPPRKTDGSSQLAGQSGKTHFPERASQLYEHFMYHEPSLPQLRHYPTRRFIQLLAIMPKLSDVAHLGKAVTDSLQRGAPDIDMVGADSRLEGDIPA
jgi:hypothetical protein